MGASLNSMTRSDRLGDLVDVLEPIDECGEYLGEAADMTSTAGYDNDGSTGPELLDNGVCLAMTARDYDPKAVIFYAYGDGTVYYVFGKDESDAVRRFRIAMGDTPEGKAMLAEADEDEDS